MISVRFDRLLASTALGLVLMAGPGHAVMAQQPDRQIAAVPMPDTSPIPPPTAADVTGTTQQAAPQDTVAPKATAAPEAPPAASLAPAPTPVAADSGISDKLRDLVTGKTLDRIVPRKAERDGIEAYYKAHNYAPLWVSAGAANEHAQQAIAYLGKADEVGLDPSDYPTPNFTAATTPDALAEAELKLTASALNFARQAQIGRIHFTRVAADIQFELNAPDPAKVLEKLAAASDAGKALDGYNPPQPEFKALRAKLAELRANGGRVEKPAEEKTQAHVTVPEGKVLHAGMKDQRVPALRQRLNVAGDKNNLLYDDAVRDAVKAFQLSADLYSDGNLGPNTVRALNGEKKTASNGSFKSPSHNPIDTIVVNMERWRWLPRDLGNPHVIVNVPNYSLALWNNDKIYWQTRIVAGGTGTHMTPMTSAEMKFITVNPTWNVPPSIIEKEYLPALQQDPQALERIGLQITQDADGTVHISQPPGAGNALGRIRFNFPNKFLVYQHDTPDKYLFAREERAYSHGCMRVQNPLTYGEKLLSLVLPSEHYTEAKLQSMFGGSEININFPKNIWVHLTYQTAFVDEDGKLQFRRDVYGRDARMIQILKGSERKVADLAIERKPESSSKPVKMPIGMYGGSHGYSGPSFFDFLFGSPAAQPQYQPRPPRNVNGRVTSR